jgi:hypothetical protein
MSSFHHSNLLCQLWINIGIRFRKWPLVIYVWPGILEVKYHPNIPQSLIFPNHLSSCNAPPNEIFEDYGSDRFSWPPHEGKKSEGMMRRSNGLIRFMEVEISILCHWNNKICTELKLP